MRCNYVKLPPTAVRVTVEIPIPNPNPIPVPIAIRVQVTGRYAATESRFPVNCQLPTCNWLSPIAAPGRGKCGSNSTNSWPKNWATNKAAGGHRARCCSWSLFWHMPQPRTSTSTRRRRGRGLTMRERMQTKTRPWQERTVDFFLSTYFAAIKWNEYANALAWLQDTKPKPKPKQKKPKPKLNTIASPMRWAVS